MSCFTRKTKNGIKVRKMCMDVPGQASGKWCGSLGRFFPAVVTYTVAASVSWPVVLERAGWHVCRSAGCSRAPEAGGGGGNNQEAATAEAEALASASAFAERAGRRIMGGASQWHMEASLKAVNGSLMKSVKRMPHKLLVLVAVVGTNVLALYTILGYSRGFPDAATSLSSSTASSSAAGLNFLSLPAAHDTTCANTNAALLAQLNATRAELHRAQQELGRAREQAARQAEQAQAEQALPLEGEVEEFMAARKLPLGWNPSLATDMWSATLGHGCVAGNKQARQDLLQFMSYSVGEQCPDDEELAQRLLLAGCEPLPRRRCFARSPPGDTFLEPLPLPDSLWHQGRHPDEEDGSYVWSAYQCKSFHCLNGRAKLKVFADCLDCFDLGGRESKRWVPQGGGGAGGGVGPASPLDFAVEEVVALKKGSLRIGLDIGGGTGSFAVRMAEQRVTVVTSTLNLGGPFNNFVARRGVVPLYMTLSQRLPFWDNTLDLVHSMHVLSNWIPDRALHFILFDIDRVLRPGGLLWLDHFFCLLPQLNSTYLPMIEALGYTKLRWVVGAKLDRGADLHEMYISALLEKPLQRHF